jgi:hypothetical protein
MNFIIILVILVSLIILCHNNVNGGDTLQVKKPILKENNLIEALTNISSADKVTLKNIKEKFSLNKKVIDQKLNQKLLEIVKKVINGVGLASENKYYIKTIENVYIMKDENGDFRAILSCFMYDINNYYTIKIILDIVSVNKIIFINHIDIDESGIKNVLKNYDIKINSRGILSNYNMFDEDTRELLDDYYRSNYKIVELSKEDYTTNRANFFTLDQLVLNYLPANVPVEKSPSFCEGNPRDNKNCIFRNSSYQPYPNFPYNAPSVITNNVDENQYTWLLGPKNEIL